MFAISNPEQFLEGAKYSAKTVVEIKPHLVLSSNVVQSVSSAPLPI